MASTTGEAQNEEHPMNMILLTFGVLIGLILLIALFCRVFFGWSFKKFFKEILDSIMNPLEWW